MQGSDKHQMMYDEASGKVSLLIKAIGPGDEGEYSCRAANLVGEGRSEGGHTIRVYCEYNPGYIIKAQFSTEYPT